MTKRTLVFIALAVGVYLAGMFVAGPFLQTEMEKHMPYIIVDPDYKSEVGCEYDYLTYIPCEVTGRDLSEGVRFPVNKIPTEYLPYVHYPDTWSHPLNPFNPANPLGNIIWWTAFVSIGIAGIGIVVYLIILWRKGALKKIKDKFS